MKPGVRISISGKDSFQRSCVLLTAFLLVFTPARSLTIPTSSEKEGVAVYFGEYSSRSSRIARLLVDVESWVGPAVEFVRVNWPSVNRSQDSPAKEAWHKILIASYNNVSAAKIQAMFCKDGDNYFTCNGSTLTKISFLDNPLSSALILHPSLCELPSLQELVLSFNPVVPDTSIPSCLGQLTNLRRLGLQNMSLVGTLPASLGNLTSAQWIRFGNNFLTGSIPDPFSSLSSLVSLQLQSNRLTGPIPEFISVFKKLRVLQLFENKFTGSIPSSLGVLPELEDLRLSDNPFFGSIPSSLGNLRALTCLELQHVNALGTIPAALGSLHNLRHLSITLNKNLTGTIPDSFNELKSLVEVYIFSNNLTGIVPRCWASLPTLTTMVLGINVSCPPSDKQPCCGGRPILNNPRLAFCQPSACRDYCTSCTVESEENLTSSPLQPGIIALIACMVLLFLVLASATAGFFLWRQRRSRKRREWEKGLSASCKKYSWEEIVKATDNFSKETFLGKGGFGSVHRGLLDDRMEVAVKRASRVELGSAGRGQFEEEVTSVHQLSHRSLVRLLGYCSTNVERILVYELMVGGPLSAHLFETYEEPLLSLEQRILVAGDVAEGLKYLHNFASAALVHRDIKAENVLLDSQFRAKIADFSLARKVMHGSSRYTRIAGTTGYMDPELLAWEKISPHSDVYSFGVLLLELISGRRAIMHPPGMSASQQGLIPTGSTSGAAGTSASLPSKDGGGSSHLAGVHYSNERSGEESALRGKGAVSLVVCVPGEGENVEVKAELVEEGVGILEEEEDSDEECMQHISGWAESLFEKENAAELGDRRVCSEDHYPVVLRLTSLAMECLKCPGSSRPSMADVCLLLHEIRQQMVRAPDMDPHATSPDGLSSNTSLYED